MIIDDTGKINFQAKSSYLKHMEQGKGQFERIMNRNLAVSSPPSNKGLVDLGNISRQTPTISQLMYKSPLKSKSWNIIYDKINADKAFHKIRPGTKIVFNPETKELLWGKELKAFLADSKGENEKTELSQKPTVKLSELSNPDHSSQLSHAVKSFIGRDYEKMDCYEMVVGGLKKMGVKYMGRNGLGQHLINQALEKGLPENHYLNGEGLVSKFGTPIFKKTIYQVKDPQIQATGLMNEMKDHLKDGQILSFSMRNKGHTGVVSKTQDQWTFINSGDMDNTLSGEKGSKKVGEEDLKSELENWFQMAQQSRQGIKITLGSFNIDQLSMFKTARINKKV